MRVRKKIQDKVRKCKLTYYSLGKGNEKERQGGRKSLSHKFCLAGVLQSSIWIDCVCLLVCLLFIYFILARPDLV